MADDVFKYFTDVEVLRSREPDYFKCTEPILIELGHKELYKHNLDKESSPASSGDETNEPTPNADSVMDRTFISILEEGSRRYYCSVPPTYSLIASENVCKFLQLPNWSYSFLANNIHKFYSKRIFITECKLYDTIVVGKGKTKKASKQAAAKEMLYKLVQKGLYKEFALGSNAEDAHAYLQTIAANVPKVDDESSSTENWVGKVQEKCQKLKLETVTYDTEESGPPNQRIFTTTCTVGKVTATGSGRTKKTSKSSAARNMYQKLEKSKLDDWTDITGCDLAKDFQRADMSPNGYIDQSVDDTSDDDLSEMSSIDGYDEDIRNMVQRIREICRGSFSADGCTDQLQKLINEDDYLTKSVFSPQELNFTIFNQRDADDCIQCILSLNGPNGEKNAFIGTGSTEAVAKNNASRDALNYLALFVRDVPRPPSQKAVDEAETVDDQQCKGP